MSEERREGRDGSRGGCVQVAHPKQKTNTKRNATSCMHLYATVRDCISAVEQCQIKLNELGSPMPS